MATDGRQEGATASALPPPPLSAPEPDDERLGSLPWSTPFLVAVAGGLSGVVWKYWYGGIHFWNASVRYFVLGGALMGLGCCVMERVAGRWPAALRWAVGMSTGAAALTFGAGVYFRVMLSFSYLSPPPALQLLRPVASACVVFAALGALLGWLSRGPTSRLLMPLAAMGLSSGASFAAVALRRWWPLLGPGHTLSMAAYLGETWYADLLHRVGSDAVLGLLLGLAMAVAASQAGRRV